MDLKVYSPEITCNTQGWLGRRTETLQYTDEVFSDIAMLREFIADNDIQQIEIVSTNIGFIKRYAKTYLTKEELQRANNTE
jgi:hypothetical protein